MQDTPSPWQQPAADRPVVVITGASSGIGRATAHEFARRGSALVLAARRQAMLLDVVRECEHLGGHAIAVPTDVTQEENVDRLAALAVEHFGRIDVWFNNAGVGVFGRLNEIPSDAWRRVLDVNLFGYMHGAKAAMRQFQRQRHGVLINNASIIGRLAKPDSSAYATSKFAIRGFSEALRQELLDEPHIHVCTVLPSVIDTPFFHHAANYSGHRVRAAPPVYAPEKVARTVVRLWQQPQAEVIVGGAGKVMAVLKALLPGPVTWLNGRALHRGFLAPEPSPHTPGTLFEPMFDERAVYGGWRENRRSNAMPPVAWALVGAGLVWALWNRRRV